MPRDVNRRPLLLPLLSLVLALPFVAGAADAPSASAGGSVWLSRTSPDGEKQSFEIQGDESAYEIGGPDGPTTMVVERPDTEDVIVELKGLPLGPQVHTFGPANERSAAAIQAIAAAAER